MKKTLTTSLMALFVLEGFLFFICTDWLRFSAHISVAFSAANPAAAYLFSLLPPAVSASRKARIIFLAAQLVFNVWRTAIQCFAGFWMAIPIFIAAEYLYWTYLWHEKG